MFGAAVFLFFRFVPKKGENSLTRFTICGIFYYKYECVTLLVQIFREKKGEYK